jgi:hypothetical protein
LNSVTLFESPSSGLAGLPINRGDDQFSQPTATTGGHMLKSFSKTLLILSCFSIPAVHAVDSDAVIGGAVGGGVGAAVGSEVGGRDGAIAGSAIGAAIGTAVMTDDKEPRSNKVYVETDGGHAHSGGPPAHAYSTPPGHVKNGKPHKWK